MRLTWHRGVMVSIAVNQAAIMGSIQINTLSKQKLFKYEKLKKYICEPELRYHPEWPCFRKKLEGILLKYACTLNQSYNYSMSTKNSLKYK